MPPGAEASPAIETPRPTLTEQVRRTLRLALPVMGGRIGLVLLITVDTAMTGRAGTEALAHYGIALAPHFFLLVTGIGLLVGTVVLTGQADGAGRQAECGAIWRRALAIGALMGLASGAVLLAGSETILRWLGQSPAIAEGGGRALAAFGPGMPAFLMYIATVFFLEGIGRPWPGMLIALAANPVNAALNWLMIEGHLGLPGWGAMGAASATTATRWLMLAALVVYVWRMRDAATYGVRAAPPGRPGGVRRLLRLGVPFAAGTGLESAAFSAIVSLAGVLGATALAATQVSVNVIAMAFMLAIGMSTATAVRVANAVGRADRQGLAAAGWLGAGLVAGLMCAVGATIAAGREVIAALYTDDAEVVAVAVPALAVVAVIVLFDGLQAVLLGSLRASGDVLVPTAMHAVSFWVVAVPSAYAVGHLAGGGAPGLLLGLLAGLATASLLLGLRFRAISHRPVEPL